MTEFQLFIDKNCLKKKDIAAYLGVSNAFITQLVQNERPLPKDKFALIKANKNWDTSMLSLYDNNQTQIGNSSNSSQQIGNNNMSNNTYNNTGGVVLEKAINEISAQRRVNEKSQEQIDRLLGIIEKMQR